MVLGFARNDNNIPPLSSVFPWQKPLKPKTKKVQLFPTEPFKILSRKAEKDNYLKSTTSTPGYFLASKAKVVSGTFTLGEKVFTL